MCCHLNFVYIVKHIITVQKIKYKKIFLNLLIGYFILSSLAKGRTNFDLRDNLQIPAIFGANSSKAPSTASKFHPSNSATPTNQTHPKVNASF